MLAPSLWNGVLRVSLVARGCTATTYAVVRRCDTHCRMPGRGEQRVELVVFLFLIVPSMVLSLLAVKQGSLGFVVVATATIFRDLALVSLGLFFLWRIGRSRDRHFGT